VNYKQIYIGEILSKTVLKYYIGLDGSFLIFTDNTFLYLRPHSGYDGDAEIEFDRHPDKWELVKAGLYPKEQYDLDKYENECRIAASNKKRRYQTYLELKEEFGD